MEGKRKRKRGYGVRGGGVAVRITTAKDWSK